MGMRNGKPRSLGTTPRETETASATKRPATKRKRKHPTQAAAEESSPSCLFDGEETAGETETNCVRENSRKKPRQRPGKSDQPRLFPLTWALDHPEAYQALIEWLQTIYEDQELPEVEVEPLPDLAAKGKLPKWLNCGMVWQGEFVSTNAPEGSGQPVEGTMLEVVEQGAVAAHYYLSPNAAKGMIRRADRMNRKFLPALRKALETLQSQVGKTPSDRLEKGHK